MHVLWTQYLPTGLDHLPAATAHTNTTPTPKTNLPNGSALCVCVFWCLYSCVRACVRAIAVCFHIVCQSSVIINRSINNFTNGKLKCSYTDMLWFSLPWPFIFFAFCVVTQYRPVGEHRSLDGKYFPFIEGWNNTPVYRNKTKETYLLLNHYGGPDKSLARPGWKQANVCVGMAWISFGALHVLSILQGCW